MAKYWGLTPSAFWACSVEDKLYMTAKMLSDFEMKAVEDYELEKKLEKAAKKSGRK